MAIISGLISVATAVGAWIGGLGAVGSFLLKTAVGIGINMLAQAIAGKPKPPTFSINGTLQSGGDLPRSFVLGRTATAGSLVWVNTWGNVDDTPNAYLTQVIALADLPVTGLRRVMVNGAFVTLDLTAPDSQGRGYPVIEYKKGGSPNLWIKFYDGNQTAVDNFLLTKCSNANRQWDARRIGYGVAYAIATAKVTKNMFSGIPSFKFELDGCPLYDITKDDTAGGAGDHRLSDPSTWGGDGDHLPAVQMYNLLRGLTWNNKWFYGVQGMATARLPAANWIRQIQKCRAPISGVAGLEPTYRSGGEITIDAPLSNALEALNTSCQGRIPEIGGIYNIHVGAPDAPVVHFTDDDILSTDEQTFTPFFGLADTINGISATYPSSKDGWVVKTAPPIFRADLEAVHGNRRLMADVSLDFVPYDEQVQRLMKSALEEGQRARRHTLVLPPRFWVYCTPGTIVSWTSKRNGYQTKLFRIDGAVDRANLDVLNDITEVDPVDYNWDSPSEFKPPVDGALGPIRPLPQPIVDWYVEPAVIRDALNKPRRPAIKLSWNGGKDDIAGVEFEVRLAANLETQYQGRSDQPEKGSMLISQGLMPNVLYGVRGRYIPVSDRPVLWSDWLPVLTDDIRFGSDDVFFDVDLDGIIEAVDKSREWFDYETREAIERARKNVLLDIEQDAANYDDKQQLRNELSAVFANAQSRWEYAVVVATGPNSAIGQRIEILEITVGEDIALAVSQLQSEISDVDGRVSANSQSLLDLMVQVDDDIATAIDLLSAEITNVDGRVTANSESLLQLSNQVGDISSSVTMRAQAESSPGGGVARWGVQLKTGSGEDWSIATFTIEIDGDISRTIFRSDQFVIAGPNGELVDPFIFENGTAYLENARIGNVVFNQMSSANNALILRGYGDFADLRMFTI